MIDEKDREQPVESPVDLKEEKERREAIKAALRRGYGGREPPGPED